MKEMGMKPVLPGYCGMVPHDAKKRLGLNVTDAVFKAIFPLPLSSTTNFT